MPGPSETLPALKEQHAERRRAQRGLHGSADVEV